MEFLSSQLPGFLFLSELCLQKAEIALSMHLKGKLQVKGLSRAQRCQWVLHPWWLTLPDRHV